MRLPLFHRSPGGHPPRRAALAAPLAAGLLVVGLAGCADSGDGSGDAGATGTDSSSAFPVTVEGDNGEVTLDARPERIVSLSPTATESLFAIGAGDQVVAVDDNSNYPKDAPTTDLSAYEPNVEAISTYEPDLVVISDDTGDVAKGLDALAIPTVQLSAATKIDDVYGQIETLGTLTGHDSDAKTLVSDLKDQIAGIVADAPETDHPLTYYYELDQNLYSVTSQTFVGSLLGELGLENIADKADADGAAGGYPQLSAEYIVDANPDLVFLADTKCCGQSAETVQARPGWDQIAAVADSGAGIVPLDDDIASRWGPRVVDLLQAALDGMQKVQAG